jgi:beta-glucanase (GH16 family)
VLVLTKDPTLTRIGTSGQWITGSVGGKARGDTSLLPLVCTPKAWQDSRCTLIKNDTTPVTYHSQCKPGDWHANRCEAKVDSDKFQLSFFNHAASERTDLELNKKTGNLLFKGGALDGGWWSYEGKCVLL